MYRVMLLVGGFAILMRMSFGAEHELTALGKELFDIIEKEEISGAEWRRACDPIFSSSVKAEVAKECYRIEREGGKCNVRYLGILSCVEANPLLRVILLCRLNSGGTNEKYWCLRGLANVDEDMAFAVGLTLLNDKEPMVVSASVDAILHKSDKASWGLLQRKYEQIKQKDEYHSAMVQLVYAGIEREWENRITEEEDAKKRLIERNRK